METCLRRFNIRRMCFFRLKYSSSLKGSVRVNVLSQRYIVLSSLRSIQSEHCPATHFEFILGLVTSLRGVHFCYRRKRHWLQVLGGDSPVFLVARIRSFSDAAVTQARGGWGSSRQCMSTLSGKERVLTNAAVTRFMLMHHTSVRPLCLTHA